MPSASASVPGAPVQRQKQDWKRQWRSADVDSARTLPLPGHWRFERLAAFLFTVRRGPIAPLCRLLANWVW